MWIMAMDFSNGFWELNVMNEFSVWLDVSNGFSGLWIMGMYLVMDLMENYVYWGVCVMLGMNCGCLIELLKDNVMRWWVFSVSFINACFNDVFRMDVYVGMLISFVFCMIHE